MIVIAHAGHWALGLLELTPLLAVAAFATWKSRAERAQHRAAGAVPSTPAARARARSSHP
jgi:hypothetical protein